MTYEDWSHFAQNWGTVYFTVIFALALGYALWPRNRGEFSRAANLPLNEKDEGDDRPRA
jgi:cytochrome c oxidase cbb3-type subunit 4